MELREIRRIYAESAVSYDRLMRLQERVLMGKLRWGLLRNARGHVLEVAVGTGLSLEHYPPGCDIVGLDASPEMLRLAVEQANSLQQPFTPVVGDAERLPFPDSSFDTVVSMLAGCTFPDPVAAFGEMRRVCRADGYILLLEHVRVNKPVIGRLQDLITPYSVRRHGCHQNRNTATNVAAAGLRITAARPSLGGYLLSIEAQPS